MTQFIDSGFRFDYDGKATTDQRENHLSMQSVPIRFMSPDTIDPIGDLEDLRYAEDFLQMMMNRMGVSYHKYGSIADKFPHEAIGIIQIIQRLNKYDEDGNVEWLIDAANYCMIEALKPSHPKAHFRATDSDESPGRINLDNTVSHGKD